MRHTAFRPYFRHRTTPTHLCVQKSRLKQEKTSWPGNHKRTARPSKCSETIIHMNMVLVSLLAICFVTTLRSATLPAAFETNVGQSAAKVKFLSRGTHYALFATEGEIVLSLAGLPTHPVRMRLP